MEEKPDGASVDKMFSIDKNRYLCIIPEAVFYNCPHCISDRAQDCKLIIFTL